MRSTPTCRSTATSIDFGQVNVGSTGGPTSVTLTNTGGDPFGPINIFGGAPPTAEFNASQNCQGTTLPAGGSCTVNFTFSPGAPGSFNDTSSFTISETSSQNDGEDFSVSLTGVGVDPNAGTLPTLVIVTLGPILTLVTADPNVTTTIDHGGDGHDRPHDRDDDDAPPTRAVRPARRRPRPIDSPATVDHELVHDDHRAAGRGRSAGSGSNRDRPSS